MPRFASLPIGIATLALVLSGCTSSAQPEVMPQPDVMPLEEFDSIPPAADTDSPMGAQSFSYLEGTWTIIATETEGSAGASVDPSGEWELAVMGDSMTVLIGDRRYEGLLTGADGDWSYYGMVTGTNAQGEPLNGYLELTATDSDEGSFAGTLLQYLDPGEATAALSTQWDVEATRH